MSLELQLVEALCGFQKPVQTLDNRTLLITSHPGTPILVKLLENITKTTLLCPSMGHSLFLQMLPVIVVNEGFCFVYLTGELIKPGDTKCVLNEGMPIHRRPFEKGRLIINFSVNI